MKTGKIYERRNTHREQGCLIDWQTMTDEPATIQEVKMYKIKFFLLGIISTTIEVNGTYGSVYNIVNQIRNEVNAGTKQLNSTAFQILDANDKNITKWYLSTLAKMEFGKAEKSGDWSEYERIMTEYRRL